MFKSLCLLVSICFLASACSTVNYNPRRGVKVEKKWYGTSFKQGKNLVNPASIAKKLGQKPQNKEKIEDFNSNYRFSQAFGILGGFAFGWSAGGGFDESGTLIGSLLMLGGSLYFGRKASRILSPMLKQRNKMVYDYKMLNHRQYVQKKDKKVLLPIYSYKF